MNESRPEPTPAPRPGLIVADAPDRQRYEASLDGAMAGVLEYVVKRDRIALVHTEVSPGHEGQGVGAGLVRFAFTDARTRGLKVIAICPYVQQWVVRHPDERDIVVGQAPG